MTDICAVVSFCSHDLRFFDKCISGLRPFCSEIVVPVCDHFYNGEPEDQTLLRRLYAAYPDLRFIEFAYSEKEVYGTASKLVPGTPPWATHWHNTSRLIGSYHIEGDPDYLLFCDVDEIFTQSPKLEGEEVIRFATYWYDRSPTAVATCTPDGPLLIKRDLVTHDLLINPYERMGMLQSISGTPTCEWKLDGEPIVHHYSFVRSKDELLAKVRRWGHHWERNWEELLEKQGDVVRGYTYQLIDPIWNPLEVSFALPLEEREPEVRITSRDLFRLEVEARFLS